MGKKKLTRKELLKKDDAFLSAASTGAKWVAGNRLLVIVACVAAVAVIGVTWAVVEYMRAQDQKASVLFVRGLELLDGQVLGFESTEEADADANPPTFATEKAKWQAARTQFRKVTTDAGASGVATLATFLAADLSEKLGEKELAEKEFLALAADLSTQHNLFFLAIERAAYLQESRGENEQALRTFSRITNVKDGFYDDVATFHQARLYLAKGEEDRARSLFERLERDFPKSPVMEQVRERLAMMGPVPSPVEGPSEKEKEAEPDPAPPQEDTDK